MIRPRVAAALLFAAISGAAGCGTGVGTVAVPTPSATPAASPSVTPASPVPSTAPPSTPPPSTPPVAASLRLGAAGPAVMALQKRLSSLGYWIATVDGRFGDSTQQAVIAFQKVANISRDGIVGPQTAAALQRAVRPAARPGLVDGVEIDLSRQVLLLVRDGIVMLAFNTSTGSGATYWSRGHLNVAVTPRGRFAVYRQVDGADVSPLGVLWRPKYFTQGIAIHGYADVPAYPASHGCVRVSFAAMNYLWATGLLPIGTPVWVV